MITAEEAQNPETAEKAAQLCRWIDNRQGHSGEGFMCVNSSGSPSNSCTVLSESSLLSEGSYRSSSGGEGSGDLHTVEDEDEEDDEDEVITGLFNLGSMFCLEE